MVVLLIWIYIWYFDYVIRCGPYPQVPVGFKKKKNQVKSPSSVSRPGNRFGSANRVVRESGRDTFTCGFFDKVPFKYFSFFEVLYPSPLLSKTHFCLARIISKAFCPQENFESEDNNHSFFFSSSSFTFSRENFEASTFEKSSLISSSSF